MDHGESVRALCNHRRQYLPRDTQLLSMSSMPVSPITIEQRRPLPVAKMTAQQIAIQVDESNKKNPAPTVHINTRPVPSPSAGEVLVRLYLRPVRA